MSFSIDFKDKNYSYDLGPCKMAGEACKGLEIYKKTSNYGDLRRLFANLSWIVSEGNPHNKQACLATQILALSVFPTLNNDYQKLFVATAVTSIYEKAELPAPASWLKAHGDYGNLVSKKYNQEEALNAGLACMDRITGKMIFKQIPKYSI